MHSKIYPQIKNNYHTKKGGECRMQKKYTQGGETGEMCDKCVCVGRRDCSTYFLWSVCVCVREKDGIGISSYKYV